MGIHLKIALIVAISICGSVLVGCGKREAPVPTSSTIPPASKPFTEDAEIAKHLRKWITDTLPADTVILGYHAETGWDGTAFERWLFHSPSGFASLAQRTDQRDALQVPADVAYDTVERPLKEVGVILGGQRPKSVWWLDWKTQTKNTDVSGLILPHASGAILKVERVTLK
jgi:hypothetical protein